MTVDERIHWMILHRKKDGIEDDIDEALDERGARKNDERRRPCSTKCCCRR